MADLAVGSALTPARSPLDPPVRRWLTGAGALLAAVLLVLAGVAVLAAQKHADDELDAQRPVVMAAAEHFTLALSSLSSGYDQSQMDAIRELSTGIYRVGLVGQAPLLHEVFKIGEVRSRGAVKLMGVERMDERSASILAVVESQVSDIKVPAGELRTYRLAISLEREGDRWLVSQVDSIS